MKKIFVIIALLLPVVGMAQSAKVVKSNMDGIRLSFAIPEISVQKVSLNGVEYNALSLDGFTSQQHDGLPALPTMVNTIEVPVGEGLAYSIVSMVCDTIDGATLGLVAEIVPAQPSRSKSDTRPQTTVKDNGAYGSDKYLGGQVVELQPLGIARSRNLATVAFNPVRWNPVTNKVIVVKRVTVDITQRHVDRAATERLHKVHYSPAFGFGVNTLNTLGAKNIAMAAPIRYTIVAHSSFRGALDDFAAWKRRKGFLVDLVYTDDPQVGTTTTSIRNYLQSLYDNATETMPAPTFVLFVGDVDQIPAFYLTAYSEQHYSDLSYCCWTGNDNLPDCYYGRFSAQTLQQLTPQISKTMMYEQYTFPDDSYLDQAALIAGVDAGYTSDNAYTYADPSMDYVAKTYVNVSNGFSDVVYYKNNTGFSPQGVTVTGSSSSTSSEAALKALYNNGCGFVNYSAHGDKTLWYKPSFQNSDIAVMTNVDKPMVMIGNCCLTNSFQIDACFGEALLRKGDNAGAVSYIGASNSTYWAEDFYWSVGVRNGISGTMNASYDASHLGMYDQLYHTHGEVFADHHITLGSMIYAGNMSVQNSSSSAQMKLYYWQIYHLMGDPSLMPYIHGRAEDIVADVPRAVQAGINSLTISTVPYAYVALTDGNGTLIAAAFADATGDAALTFAPLVAPLEYEVAITAQGYKPFFQTFDLIMDGPYVVVEGLTADATLQAGGETTFSLKLINVGNSAAQNVTVEFQNTDGMLNIDALGAVSLNASMAQGDTLQLSQVFHTSVWDNAKDQSTAKVSVLVRWDGASNAVSRSSKLFVVDACNIATSGFNLVDNGDNTATLTVGNVNNGHTPMADAVMTLLPLDPMVAVASQQSTLGNIAVGGTATASVALTSDNMPDDRTIPFIKTVSNGAVSFVDTISVTFGVDMQLITFESGNWGDVAWTHGSNPWEITSDDAYSGTYCARSKSWGTGTYDGGDEKSELTIVWTSSVDDSITFYRKVSSEENYDVYRFYIDGSRKETASGTSEGWVRRAYFVAAGTHTFKFSYEKDYSVSYGDDCVKIDNLHLPLAGTAYSYTTDGICQGEGYVFGGNALATETLESGVHYFTDTVGSVVNFLTLFVDPRPQLVLTASSTEVESGNVVRLAADGADRYVWSNGMTNSVVDVLPQQDPTVYRVDGYNGNCKATDSVTIRVSSNAGLTVGGDAVSVSVSPNPTSGLFTVAGSMTITEVVVADMLGRTVLTKRVSSDTVLVDITSLPKGVFFVVVTAENGEKTTCKLIKK